MTALLSPRADHGTHPDLVQAKLAAEAVSVHGNGPAPLRYTPDTGFTVATLSGLAAMVATMLGFAIMLVG